MLFNSYLFLFAFLPVALVGYELVSKVNRKAVVVWLGLCSLAFYAWWQPSLLLILVGSITLNYLAAELIVRYGANRAVARRWLYVAIACNLLLLGYYKYLVPSLNAVSQMAGLHQHWGDIVLPLGISFFTLTQVAFLIDLYKGSAEQQGLSSYVLFVTFFPHLIAGPILHHREMMPQFQKERFGVNQEDFAVGLTWFVMGLGKKVLIADTLAMTANPIFQASTRLPIGMAWLGALAFTLQLYFDFSGYSDMALGLARMFSIDLPLNFNSPSKAASMIEVWQRWHMTLGHYIFTYVYSPVQKRVLHRRYQRLGWAMARQERTKPVVFLSVVALPLMFTMFLAGVWHGAGLHFMIFGLLHGFYLSVNHGWRQFRRTTTPGAAAVDRFLRLLRPGVRHVAAIGVTFLCNVVSLVFFRSDSLMRALEMLGAMVGLNGTAPHGAFLNAGAIGVPVVADAVKQVLAGLFIVWALPNTQQILTRFRPSLERGAWNQSDVPTIFRWAPTTAWAIGVGGLLFVCLVYLRALSTFLYFQF